MRAFETVLPVPVKSLYKPQVPPLRAGRVVGGVCRCPLKVLIVPPGPEWLPSACGLLDHKIEDDLDVPRP